jgi:hypothetical protein
MITYKHTFSIKILFEMNGGQPAQQELFQAEFPLGIKKKIENVLFYQT